ncbi:hypothetical protein TNCV_1711871 [Trichonephila clavipes]|nr:hypothetical protein TNCV_1711871 [Trichonephila clavipes]
MDENRTTEKVFKAQPIGTRRKGRPNLRWIGGLEKDLVVLRIKNWRTLADILHSAVAGFVIRLECVIPCGGGYVEHILL